MKICLLAPANNPHTQKIALSLRDKGHQIFICTFHNSRLPGISVKYFPSVCSCLGKLNYLLSVKNIRHFINQINPHIVHAHYVSSYGVVGYLSRFHPLIVSVWGMDIYDAPNNIILHYLIKRTLNAADRVLSTSHVMKKQTQRFTDRNDIIVTPFGVNTQRFCKKKISYQRRFTIGTARILAPKYGIEYLLRAFAQIQQRIPDAQLLIAGEGPQKTALQKLARELQLNEKVTFLGFVQPHKMPAFFSNIDIFCMPSISESESFGVAALEAQACGIPVIASDIGGLLETVKNNETGFLVKPKDSSEIAQKAIYLFKNSGKRTEMGEAGIVHVKKQYDWYKNINLIERVYQQLMRNQC